MILRSDYLKIKNLKIKYLKIIKKISLDTVNSYGYNIKACVKARLNCVIE